VTFWKSVPALENQFQYRSVRTGLILYALLDIDLSLRLCRLSDTKSERKKQIDKELTIYIHIIFQEEKAKVSSPEFVVVDSF